MADASGCATSSSFPLRVRRGERGEEFVFARDGKQRVLDFTGAWDNACERAGCPGLLFQGLHCTGERYLRCLHVAEGVIMKIGG